MDVIGAVIRTAILVWVISSRRFQGVKKASPSHESDLAIALHVKRIMGEADALASQIGEVEHDATMHLYSLSAQVRMIRDGIVDNSIYDLSNVFLIDAFVKSGEIDSAWNIFDLMDESPIKSEISRMHPTLETDFESAFQEMQNEAEVEDDHDL